MTIIDWREMAQDDCSEYNDGNSLPANKPLGEMRPIEQRNALFAYESRIESLPHREMR